MNRVLLSGLAVGALGAMALPASAAYYVAGAFNGWTSNGNLMTDNLDGSHSVNITGLTDGTRYEFKVTDGTWDNAWPSANSWLYAIGTDTTITFRPGAIGDGWLPDTNRIGVSDDGGNWVAVGDFQSEVGGSDWSNSDVTTTMVSQGGGIYLLQGVVSTAGTYEYKAVRSGTWDAIGSDSRTVNAGTTTFTTTDPNQTVKLWLDAVGGGIKTEVLPIPEPASLSLLGLGALGLLRRRK